MPLEMLSVIEIRARNSRNVAKLHKSSRSRMTGSLELDKVITVTKVLLAIYSFQIDSLHFPKTQFCKI